jgi:ligand-binding SRPBCC domain-containing protein
MHTEIFRQLQQFKQNPADLFPFFASPENLQLITPHWLKFKIRTQLPVDMHESAIIDYSLQLHGLPVFWRSMIRNWSPPNEFTDTQIKGPFKLWTHRHQLITNSEGTLMIDTVHYQVPGGPFAGLINRMYVRRDVARIFAYRKQVLAELFT